MKKVLTYIIILGATSLLLSLSASYMVPDEWIANIKNLLDTYNQKIPEEKVYMHIDKTLLKPGETIWFAAYITSGEMLTPTTVSNTLIVELINPKGNVANELRLKITEGKASGNFAITTEMPGGIYTVRAYTQWQKNWDEKYFFKKEITVQKVVTPRILITMDYLKEAYGPGDSVIATIKINDLENNPIQNYPLSYVASLGGKEYSRAEAYSDKMGEIRVSLILPESLNTNDGLINTIINYEGSTESISRSIPIILNKIDLQFFPEGGHMLAGYKNRVAFKATNETGNPADVTGVIFNDKMEEISVFESYHQGMGAFWFIPETNHQYYAKIIKPAGNDTVYKLPEAVKEGLALIVSNENMSRLNLNITSSKSSTVIIIAQVRGKIYYSGFTSLKKGINNFQIPLQSFPAGVAQITLFNESGIPQLERMVFVNKQKRMNIQISADKKKYSPNDKVRLDIRTTDENEEPVESCFSLSVVNEKILSYADDKQDNILSSLWLSSEVIGEIFEPSFYFKKDEPKADQALDYLLMTQAWRRFTWKMINDKNYDTKYSSDREGILVGKVIHRYTGDGVKAKIGVVITKPEVYGAEIVTDDDGNFTITHLDPSSQIKLFAKAINAKTTSIRIDIDNTLSSYATGYRQQSKWNYQNEVIPKNIKQKVEFQRIEIIEDNQAPDANEPEPNSGKGVVRGMSTVMVEDILSLDECVVVGYGVQKKTDITSSIVTVDEEEIMATLAPVEEALQGKVAGVSIYHEPLQADGGNLLKVRGQNSVLNPDPLYVIDGIPLFETVSNSLTPLSYLTMDDINSIVILKSPKSNATYGSSGGNSVSFIETEFVDYRYDYYSRNNKRKYAVLILNPKLQYDVCREFYIPTQNYHNTRNQRNDFRSTIYWTHDVKTDKNGKASIEFQASDEISTFRTVVEGLSSEGLAGHSEMNYYTQLPVSLSLKLPAYITKVDTVLADIQIKNNFDKAIEGQLELLLPRNIMILDSIDSQIAIPGNSSKTIRARLIPSRNEFKYGTITLNFRSSRYSDRITHRVDILPYGFPVEASYSGMTKDETIFVDIAHPVEGTLTADFFAYPSLLADLQEGMESIFRSPHGCFEQVSAATYPNVLALRFLKETGKVDRSLQNKALEYIEKGYAKLSGYETSLGGFEWYGHTPPHEGLTAFGLMEFIDMRDVYDGVSDKLIERTKEWLLSRRKGDGSFNLTKGKYGFSSASPEVSNAYIVYALSESGIPSQEIEKEFESALQESMKSKDSYRLALMTNAAYNLKKDSIASQLLSIIKKQILKYDYGNLPVNHTLTYSWGKSAQIETAALILMAELKSPMPEEEFYSGLILFLSKNRAYGGFGSTQATTLALKALSEMVKYQSISNKDSEIMLYVNDTLMKTLSINNVTLCNTRIKGLEKYLQNGRNKIRILFKGTEKPIPYSVDMSWHTYTPTSGNKCWVKLESTLANEKVSLGETVRFSARLTNTKETGIPMTIAILGIPGGLTPQPWQLKELQEKEEFAYYEIHMNYLVIYYREIGPGEIKTIDLDLKTEVKGSYTAPASSAYLYYTPEEKHWIAGEKIIIE